MKKLMLAAAAAAMIGGLQAAPAASDVKYNFVAVLRTTGAATGFATPTAPQTIRLALNRNTTTFNPADWWYNDPAIVPATSTLPQSRAAAVATAGANLYVDNAVVGGKTVRHLYLLNAADVKGADRILLNYLNGRYNRPQKINGADIYCCTLSFAGVNAGQCYRIASVDRIQDTLYLNSCCTAGTFFKDDSATTAPLYPAVITYGGGADANLARLPAWFIQGFGGQTPAAAVNNEIFATVETTTVNGRWFNGYIAGQGTWIAVAPTVRYPQMISGNIVGVEEAPQCVTCCDGPEPAVAFTCAETSTSTGAGSVALNTAAFGTFYITYAGTY